MLRLLIYNNINIKIRAAKNIYENNQKYIEQIVGNSRTFYEKKKKTYRSKVKHLNLFSFNLFVFFSVNSILFLVCFFVLRIFFFLLRLKLVMINKINLPILYT